MCLSEAVYVQVRDRLLLNFLDLREQKVKNIARPLRGLSRASRIGRSVKSPFRGLDRFKFEHSGLFFCRAHAVSVCHERLEQLAANGKSFLLIYGMSSSENPRSCAQGFSRYRGPGTVAGIMLWQRCLFRPFEEADVIPSLVAGLIREGALPEQAQESTTTELTQLLRHAPDRAVGLIRVALVNAAAAGSGVQSSPGEWRGSDGGVVCGGGGARVCEGFVRVLAMFAECGFIWVIGTIRADFFHRCDRIPGFSELKDGLSSYELLPPSGRKLPQIIREPARATGLRFEEDHDHGRLDDVLQVAAVADAGSLPLLNSCSTRSVGRGKSVVC